MNTVFLQWKTRGLVGVPVGNAARKIWRQHLFSWRTLWLIVTIAWVMRGLWCGDYPSVLWCCFWVWIMFGQEAPDSLKITSRGIDQKSWRNGLNRIGWSEIEFYKLWKPSREHEWKLEVKARRGKKIKRLYVGFDDREIAAENLRRILHQYLPSEKELI